MLNNFFTSITKLIINKSTFMYLGAVMRYLTCFYFLICIFSSNVQANQLMDVAKRADNLKASAGKCYLSVPQVYLSTVASLYLNANKMFNNGVRFIKMKQTGTAINMLKSANAQYENMLRVGRQV